MPAPSSTLSHSSETFRQGQVGPDSGSFLLGNPPAQSPSPPLLLMTADLVQAHAPFLPTPHKYASLHLVSLDVLLILAQHPMTTIRGPRLSVSSPHPAPSQPPRLSWSSACSYSGLYL